MVTKTDKQRILDTVAEISIPAEYNFAGCGAPGCICDARSAITEYRERVLAALRDALRPRR